MNRTDVAIATVSLVRDAADDRLLRESLARLARERFPVAVADGGSPGPFVAFLRALPGVTLAEPAARGLIAQVAASVETAAACGTSHILYTEPDKLSFFDRDLAAFVEHAADADDVSVTIAARSAASFETFPAFQRLTESAVNGICGELIGAAGDYTYGPFIFRRELAAHLGALPPTLGWGWRPFLFDVARRCGGRIVHVVGDYRCPPGQRDADERVHRLRQLSQNIDGLALAETIAL